MSKQETSELSIELQFLDVHKREYLELSADFAKIFYMPKTKPVLANMKQLILLDLKIFLVAENPWRRSSK